jgi:hypothetical protein
VGEKKEDARGFNSIPNLPRRCIKVIEFCGGNRGGCSVRDGCGLFLVAAVLLVVMLGRGGGAVGERQAGGGRAVLQGGRAAQGQGRRTGAGATCRDGQGEGLARLVQLLLLAVPRGRGGLGWAWRRRRTGQKDAMAALSREMRCSRGTPWATTVVVQEREQENARQKDARLGLCEQDL